jgi:hypothetical protein
MQVVIITKKEKYLWAFRYSQYFLDKDIKEWAMDWHSFDVYKDITIEHDDKFDKVIVNKTIVYDYNIITI